MLAQFQTRLGPRKATRNEFTKILLLSETYRRPIEDPSETHRRPTCFIGDPSETDMPHRRPIGDQHVSSEIHQRPTCLIGDRLASSETPRRPTYFIGDPSETDMPHRRSIEDQHASSETHGRPTCLIGDQDASLETHNIQSLKYHMSTTSGSKDI